MSRREFITLLGGRRRRGRSRRARSRASDAADRRAHGDECGRTGITNPPRCVPAGAAGGRRVPWAECAAGSNTAGPRATARGCVHMRRSSSRSARTLSWLASARRTRPCNERAAQCRSFSPAQAIDPVGAGIVASLARPGRNATGFTQFDIIQLERKMARAAQGGPAARDTQRRAPRTRTPPVVSENGRSFRPGNPHLEWS